jgi:pyruvate kinase
MFLLTHARVFHMEELAFIRTSLEEIEGNMQDVLGKNRDRIDGLPVSQRAAASNLIRYLALRNRDIRDLQKALHVNGLSSLASSESHILRQVQSILQRLGKDYPQEQLSPCDYDSSRQSIDRRSNTLFGTKTDSGIPFIMVTLDADAIDEQGYVEGLLRHGMNVARINCAHDDQPIWKMMIASVKEASRKSGRSCRIYMDLAGPKLRTTILGKGKKKNRMQIREGDRVVLAGETANFDKKERVVGLSLAGIMPCLERGHRVLFDDAAIASVVEETQGDMATIRITRMSAGKRFLRAEKGVNLPDTTFNTAALTAFDRACLPFVCANADLVGFSFVETEEGLEELQGCLAALGAAELPIVLKIERPMAVNNLPALLLQGMHQETFGIMVARGDLAVEIGFERLSEIQEEILWLSEAAHVPVIWATQVLENLNRSGLPTRAEITDAAHAANAECVMINKGNHILFVMDALRDILQRSGTHHIKKRYVFRPLNIAHKWLQDM